MGIFENLLREESEFERRLRERREALGERFNIADEILEIILRLPSRARQEVFDCVSKEVSQQTRELARDKAYVERIRSEFAETRKNWSVQFKQEKKYLEDRDEQLDDRELELANELAEAQQIKARAYNAMKAAERIKRKAEKKIADFEALVDR